MAQCLQSSGLGTPTNTYLYTLSQSPSHQELATIASDDSFRLFNADLTALHTTSQCHTGVACLTSGDRTAFVTAGRDGLVRGWDRVGSKVAELRDARGNGFSAVASRDFYIAAGNESTKEGLGDVSVSIFDLRNPSVPLRQYNESHTDSITRLAFHPDHPNLLLSGSTDGLVSLFDVNHADEDDALQHVLNPRSAIHCAGFLAADQAYVVSTDEHFSVYTLPKTDSEDEELPAPQQFGDVRDTLPHCSYVVDVLTQPNGPPVMVYGHNDRQTLTMVSLGLPGAWKFGPTLDLQGAHGEDVVRDALIYGQRAYSCGEDGMVRLWKLD